MGLQLQILQRLVVSSNEETLWQNSVNWPLFSGLVQALPRGVCSFFFKYLPGYF